MSKSKTTIVQSLLTMLEINSSTDTDVQMGYKNNRLALVTTAGTIIGTPLSQGEIPNRCILLEDVILLTPAEKTFEYAFLYVFLDDIIAATICNDN